VKEVLGLITCLPCLPIRGCTFKPSKAEFHHTPLSDVPTHTRLAAIAPTLKDVDIELRSFRCSPGGSDFVAARRSTSTFHRSRDLGLHGLGESELISVRQEVVGRVSQCRVGICALPSPYSFLPSTSENSTDCRKV
jgi:hypothetical protein